MTERATILVLLLLLCLVGTGCDDGGSGEPASTDTLADTEAEVAADTGADEDADADTDAVGDADADAVGDDTADSSAADTAAADGLDAADSVGPNPDATQYCELGVEMFCDYYLRCGRMAVDDLAACRVAFGEACNAVYEPIYAALADAGRLALSGDGLDACASHLATVACDAQLFDLDGGCAAVWQGLAPAGAACGPGLESFVCAPGTTCVLDLSLCGICEASAAVGEACGDAAGGLRCGRDAQCVDGVCVARGAPGTACGAQAPCVVGASCVEGLCVGSFEVVALGEACDQARRCPYKSACVGGSCVAAGLRGEACPDGVCASGWCDAGTCAALLDAGAACTASSQCSSSRCDAGSCAAIAATFCAAAP